MNPAVNEKLEALRRQLEADEKPEVSPGIKRLMSDEVGYMELPMKVVGFACGGCKFFKPDNNLCQNEKVKTEVSGGSGCCNLFYPIAKDPVPPERWQARIIRKELKGSRS